MSADSYGKWWNLSKKQLSQLQIYDKLMTATTKPTKDRVRAGILVSGLYCKYCMIVQEIDACLDQLAQVQKCVTIRKLMDSAVMRLNELKEMLTEIDLSEFHYVDGTLVELKLVPYNVEILNPALLFPRQLEITEMWNRIKNGEKIFIPPPPPEKLTDINPDGEVGPTTDEGVDKPSEDKTNEEEKPPEPPKEASKPKKKQIKKFVLEAKILSQEEIEALQKKERITSMVKLIQTHERARQARLYFMDRNIAKMQSPNPEKERKKTVAPDPEVTNSAALDFQRLWRGHAVRQKMKRREADRRLMIGMTEPSWRSTKEQEKVQMNIERRREIVRKHVQEYIKANLDEKERVMRVVAPGLMEDIGDEIREWFYQWYIRAKNFDKYPPPEKGGTVLVVRCETMTPEEWLEEVEKKRKEREKLKQSGGADKEKEKAEKKKKEAEKKKAEAAKKKKEAEAKRKAKRNQEFEFAFKQSNANQQTTNNFKDYNKLWSERTFEDNPDDKVYMDMVNDDVCYEMQLEVRTKVDELMRLELELLNDALAYDKAKKKGKKGKGQKAKKKKGKKGKRGKKAKKKDPTGHRTTEDLFQELVDCGVIHTYPETHLVDFKGDMSYANWDKRAQEFDPPSTLGDVRQVVTLTCVLPMGVEEMVKPRSVLIAGPRKSGKHLLANAIFTETKAVLFDLSPRILAEHYKGKAEMKMLLHLINKMSRLLQPSVIYFDGGEKPFYKKVPPPEKDLDPKKMGKQLYKGIVKTIKPEDRVLVLGITCQPWAAKAAGLKKAFERVILLPRTDYGSAYLYWRELLMPYHGINRDIDVSCLAKLSKNYPMGLLKQFVQTLLTPRRIVELSYQPLQQAELYALMIDSRQGEVTEKEYNKFIKWYKKTPLGKKRAKYNKIAEKKREAEEKQAAKAAEKAARKK